MARALVPALVHALRELPVEEARTQRRRHGLARAGALVVAQVVVGQARVSGIAYLGTWSAVKRHAAEAPGPEPGRLLDRASERLAPIWGAEPRRVTMPIYLRVGRRRDAAAHSV